jgi:magnesium transporter
MCKPARRNALLMPGPNPLTLVGGEPVSSRIERRRKKVGAAPGTLVHIGEQRTEEARIRQVVYRADDIRAADIEAQDLMDRPSDGDRKLWINIEGLHDTALVQKIGERFGIHLLTLEDIVNTQHRPKVDDHDNYLFIVLKMLHYNAATSHLTAEQLSLVLLDGCLLSFQEAEGEVFNPVCERLQRGRGRIRNLGCDYLAYALIDAVVDHYFVILEQLGTEIENLEEALLLDPDAAVINRIHALKKEMIFLRKQVWPLRELIATLERNPSDLIQQKTAIFIRDVYDHTIQVIDTVESYRDLLSSLLDLYLSSVSFRMNEVMKVLTIIATIFIPITFVAGIYGMNFRHMPELEWRWGYAAAWGLMAAITITMLYYFKRKKWF